MGPQDVLGDPALLVCARLSGSGAGADRVKCHAICVADVPTILLSISRAHLQASLLKPGAEELAKRMSKRLSTEDMLQEKVETQPRQSRRSSFNGGALGAELMLEAAGPAGHHSPTTDLEDDLDEIKLPAETTQPGNTSRGELSGTGSFSGSFSGSWRSRRGHADGDKDKEKKSPWSSRRNSGASRSMASVHPHPSTPQPPALDTIHSASTSDANAVSSWPGDSNGHTKQDASTDPDHSSKHPVDTHMPHGSQLTHPEHEALPASTHANAVMAIYLGIMIDAIPESLVIGMLTTSNDGMSAAFIVGVFLANFPEAMSSAVTMRQYGMPFLKVLFMWTTLCIFTGVGAGIGAVVLDSETNPVLINCIEGVAAGAMLTMISETMLPEAFNEGGHITGMSTLLGFLAAFLVKGIAMIEDAGGGSSH